MEKINTLVEDLKSKRFSKIIEAKEEDLLKALEIIKEIEKEWVFNTSLNMVLGMSPEINYNTLVDLGYKCNPGRYKENYQRNSDYWDSQMTLGGSSSSDKVTVLVRNSEINKYAVDDYEEEGYKWMYNCIIGVNFARNHKDSLLGGDRIIALEIPKQNLITIYKTKSKYADHEIGYLFMKLEGIKTGKLRLWRRI